LAGDLFARLERALTGGWGRWSLNLEGQDPRGFLFDLVKALKGSGPDGAGKRIENRHRYVGLGPTLAWLLVCRDPSYPVMYDSIESFARLWDACQSALGGGRYHYVSLGVGTGDKDRHIIDRLLPGHADLFYVPVDISGQMLRLGTAEMLLRMPGRVLPIELDFEDPSAIEALRGLLDDLLGDEPILFSLLGSSLANIDNEAGFLKTLTQLLREQDRLALEVATTQRLDATAAQAAAEERAASRLYNEFATAALGTYTDLTIDTNWLQFTGSIEDGRAVRVEGHYVNCTDDTITLTLPNRETIPYRTGEGIRVLLGRKYLPDKLRRMLADCQLTERAFESGLDRPGDPASVRAGNFGLALMLLQHTPRLAVPQTPLSRVWGTSASPPHNRPDG
jgi:uncharacterized SAM-dependent methyltransferase